MIYLHYWRNVGTSATEIVTEPPTMGVMGVMGDMGVIGDMGDIGDICGIP